MPQPTLLIWIGGAVALVSLGAIALGLHGRYTARRRERAWTAAAGRVIENVVTGHRAIHPRVEYTGANGQTVRFQSRHGGYPAAYAVDQEVTVLYDPSDPAQAEIRGEGRSFDYLMMGFGAFMIVFGAALLGFLYWATPR